MFYEDENFKSILINKFNLLKRELKRDLDREFEEKGFIYSKETYLKILVKDYIPEFVYAGEVLFDNIKTKSKKSKVYNSSIYELIEIIKNDLRINSEFDSEEFVFLKNVYGFVLKVILNDFFIPKVTEINNTDFIIDYVVIKNSNQIKEYFDYLTSLVPKEFVVNENNEFLQKEFIVDYVISIFIKALFEKFVDFEKNKVERTFFSFIKYVPSKFQENSTCVSIENWLQSLYFYNLDYSIAITMKTVKGDFEVSLSIENKKDNLKEFIDINDFFVDKKYSSYTESVYKQIAVISNYHNFIEDIFKKKNKKSRFSIEKIQELIEQAFPVLNVIGVSVIFPKELKRLSSPKIKTKISSERNSLSIFNLYDMLNFDYEIHLDNLVLSKDEFISLFSKAQKLVKIKDHFVFIEPDEILNILEKLKKPDNMEIAAMILGDIENNDNYEIDDNLKSLLKELKKTKNIRVPKSLNATLRKYQETGYKWIFTNLEKGFNVCIADDMGLGKTIQVITYILKKKEQNALKKPVLIVCPTSLLGNWAKEFEKFAPDVDYRIYHGIGRKFEYEKDVILTTYSMVRNEIELFKQHEWDLTVIDEAQNIKNPQTSQARAIKALNSSAKLAMTGTPVENSLIELWSIFDFLMPGYLGNNTKFKHSFSIPIEKYQETEKLDMLKTLIDPFLIRREKTDKNIISDLPDKIIYDEYVYLKPAQVALYKEFTENMISDIEKSENIERKGLILKAMINLKQICNHPANYSKSGDFKAEDSGKTERLVEIAETVIASNEKMIIFTQFTEMGDILKAILEKELEKEVLFYHGSLTVKKREKMIEDFQTKHKFPIMIISLKAGGTGLNLTAANHVVHYDLWWNPAVENQATDRAFRIGQNKNVFVHRFISLQTFEEKINQMIQQKISMFKNVISAGESWITELSDDDIKDIFSLRRI